MRLSKNHDLLAHLRRLIHFFLTFSMKSIFALSNSKHVAYPYLSYDVAVIQWITSCHKKCMTTRTGA